MSRRYIDKEMIDPRLMQEVETKIEESTLSGPKGDKGDPGVDGIIGKDGAQGPKGDKGDKGDAGTPANLEDYALKETVDHVANTIDYHMTDKEPHVTLNTGANVASDGPAKYKIGVTKMNFAYGTGGWTQIVSSSSSYKGIVETVALNGYEYAVQRLTLMDSTGVLRGQYVRTGKTVTEWGNFARVADWDRTEETSTDFYNHIGNTTGIHINTGTLHTITQLPNAMPMGYTIQHDNTGLWVAAIPDIASNEKSIVEIIKLSTTDPYGTIQRVTVNYLGQVMCILQRISKTTTTWGSWLMVAPVAEPKVPLATWNTVTLKSGWIGSIVCSKDAFGIKRIIGEISGGTTTSSTVLFTLPANERPTAILRAGLGGSTNTNPGIANVQIATNGDCSLTTTGLQVMYFDITYR